MRDISARFQIKPQGVLHIGAHLAEEAELYESILPRERRLVIWIESQPEKCKEIRLRLDPSIHEVLEATIWHETGIEMTFHETNNSESSSLFELGRHSEKYPEVVSSSSRKVITTRIEDLVLGREFDFVNLDIQGAELNALKGFGGVLDQVTWIYTEVSKIELYKNGCLIHELDAFLKEHSFTRVSTRWIWNHGWGDAIFIKDSKATVGIRMAAVLSDFEWFAISILRLIRAAIPERVRNFLRKIQKRLLNK
jgi:FkbM family methyltransferase